ncbi:MAG TPA: hypothetical protein VGF13_12680 [Verrucomicrobiae bacterium]|jgi:hypothetical protein
MSDLNIDLKAQIDELKNRRSELLAIREAPPGPTPDEAREQRKTISVKELVLLEKITALERIQDDLGAQITVTGLTEEQKTKAEKAMTALSKSIQKEQAFDAMMKAVEGLLTAADTIHSTAKS